MVIMEELADGKFKIAGRDSLGVEHLIALLGSPAEAYGRYLQELERERQEGKALV